MADENNQPEVYHPAVSAIARGASREELAVHAAQRQDEESAWQRQDRAAQRQLAEHTALLHESQSYLQMANDMAKTEQEAKQNIQAADFLSKAKDLHVVDPNYEESLAKLHAEYPRAAGHPAVQDYLTINAPARHMYLQSQETGAAPGPAATLKHVAAGLLQPEDFAWTDPAKRPEIYNEDGSINHVHASWLAASRAGQGLGTKGEARDITEAKGFITRYPYKAIEDMEDGPQKDNLKALHEIYTDRLLTHERGSAPAPASTPAPSAVPGKTPAPDNYTDSETFKKAYQAADPGATVYYNGKPWTKPKAKP